MLSVYTRHTNDCKQSDINYRKCRCPKWIQGTVDGQKGSIRASARTRSWDQAERTARKMEQEAIPGTSTVEITEAVVSYLKARQGSRIAASTLYRIRVKYEHIFLPWCAAHDLKNMKQLSSPVMQEFIADRELALDNQAARCEFVELKKFFQHAIAFNWLVKNPMSALIAPTFKKEKDTDVFTPDEFKRLVDATTKLRHGCSLKSAFTPMEVQRRALAHILLMRYSGLSIKDATLLERSRLDADNNLLLRRAKTKVEVFVPLPPHVADLLRATPGGTATFFFYNEKSKPNVFINNMRRLHNRVYKHAKMTKRCHPHMLRDTFAVELLLKNVPLDQVATLLGHSNVKTTWDNYAPFVKARQAQLLESVQKTWDDLPSFGPRLVQQKTAGA